MTKYVLSITTSRGMPKRVLTEIVVSYLFPENAMLCLVLQPSCKWRDVWQQRAFDQLYMKHTGNHEYLNAANGLTSLCLLIILYE
jgi:hypothetical protein